MGRSSSAKESATKMRLACQSCCHFVVRLHVSIANHGGFSNLDLIAPSPRMFTCRIRTLELCLLAFGPDTWSKQKFVVVCYSTYSFFFFLVFLLRSIIIVLYLSTSDWKILQHRRSRKESRETDYCTRTRLSTTTLGTEALLMIGSVVDAYYMYLD